MESAIRIRAETERNLESKACRNFNLITILGFVTGAVAIYAGRKIGSEDLIGFGSGVVIMDAVQNIAYRGIRYFRGK